MKIKRNFFFIAATLVVLCCLQISTADVGVAETELAPEPFAQRVTFFLQGKGLPRELVVLLISMLPVIELRGAIPVAHIMGMNPLLAYLLAVVGNMIPVVPILLFLGPVSRFLSRFRLGNAFFSWFFARAKRKSAAIEKYQTLGLAMFVAIPLPVTGAWTGCAAAFLMGVQFKHAVPAILLGVMIAGTIMTLLSILGIYGAIIAGVVLLGLLILSLLKLFKKETRESVELAQEIEP